MAVDISDGRAGSHFISRSVIVPYIASDTEPRGGGLAEIPNVNEWLQLPDEIVADYRIPSDRDMW